MVLDNYLFRKRSVKEIKKEIKMGFWFGNLFYFLGVASLFRAIIFYCSDSNLLTLIFIFVAAFNIYAGYNLWDSVERGKLILEIRRAKK